MAVMFMAVFTMSVGHLNATSSLQQSMIRLGTNFLIL